MACASACNAWALRNMCAFARMNKQSSTRACAGGGGLPVGHRGSAGRADAAPDAAAVQRAG
eukprot:54705-Chlamydomonas_euryale.AAC.1